MISKRAFVATIVALSFVSICVGMYVHRKAFKAGIDSYHQMCFNTPGYVIDFNDGTVVQCMGLTTLSKEELSRFQAPK